jgi:hypothetical protein
VTGCCEHGDEPSGSGNKELVSQSVSKSVCLFVVSWSDIPERMLLDSDLLMH